MIIPVSIALIKGKAIETGISKMWRCWWLQELRILNEVCSTLTIQPRLFNPKLPTQTFQPWTFHHQASTPDFSTMNFSIINFPAPDLSTPKPKGMSSHYKLPGHFHPGLFNPELFSPLAQKIMVEKFMVGKSRALKVHGWKVWGWKFPFGSGVELSEIEAWWLKSRVKMSCNRWNWSKL